MPMNEEHCRISLLRTGNDFKALHAWMDEPSARLGKDHRKERHDSSWLSEVVRLFGKESIEEFFHHIFVDNKDTERQWLYISEESVGKECIDYQYVFTCSKCACHAYFPLTGGKLCIKCLNFDRAKYIIA